MIEKVKQKIALLCINRAAYLMGKGGFKNTMKGLDWVKRSIKFANKEERDYLKAGFDKIIKEYSDNEEES